MKKYTIADLEGEGLIDLKPDWHPCCVCGEKPGQIFIHDNGKTYCAMHTPDNIEEYFPAWSCTECGWSGDELITFTDGRNDLCPGCKDYKGLKEKEL